MPNHAYTYFSFIGIGMKAKANFFGLPMTL